MALSKDVERARDLAFSAHYGAVDKAGAPYILHPERVAERLSSPEEKVVGWLHDVVEDTDVSLGYIAETFGEETAEAVDRITHRKGESWSRVVAESQRLRSLHSTSECRWRRSPRRTLP